MKVQSLQGKGFTPIKLLMIIVLGVIIGAGAYIFYKNSTRSASRISKEELTEAVETTKAVNSQTLSTQGNFSQKGTLIAREDGWTLLWDESGQLALNVKLKFADQSVCFLGGEKKDCGLINMGPKIYDYVSVEGERNNGEVTVIKFEELKLPQ